ncbi:import receptor subunit tom40 [Anaeramoeba flamelloides]|uniref:Import receptor subunit tom40 n=1 Tax=Anaeramoeba flamelloides TaxID=1746091 RepID=A0ABQ8YVI7_9EUKA|nr:import receptor subunit tom40 [Anaeramoeba flamelloides]
MLFLLKYLDYFHTDTNWRLSLKLSLYGNIDNNGFLRGHLLAQLTQTLSSEAVFNLEGQDDLSTWIWNLEHKGKLSTSRAEITSTSICAFSYYQRVTPKLSLGTRLTYLHPLRQTKLMFIARLRNKQNICSFTYSGMLNSLSLSYVRKIQPRVGFATEIVYSLREGSSFTSLGFKYSLRKVVFHSKITSNDELSTSLEMGFPIVKLTFTAKMDYKVKKYYAGIRVSIGPVL